MTAELLRRAAGTLRKRVARLPEPWATRPWRQVQTDTESMDGIAVCAVDHTDPYGAFDCCWSSEPIGHEAVASLAALMHPPVALALADWLDAEANHAEDWPDESEPAYAVARGILREVP